MFPGAIMQRESSQISRSRTPERNFGEEGTDQLTWRTNVSSISTYIPAPIAFWAHLRQPRPSHTFHEVMQQVNNCQNKGGDIGSQYSYTAGFVCVQQKQVCLLGRPADVTRLGGWPYCPRKPCDTRLPLLSTDVSEQEEYQSKFENDIVCCGAGVVQSAGVGVIPLVPKWEWTRIESSKGSTRRLH